MSKEKKSKYMRCPICRGKGNLVIPGRVSDLLRVEIDAEKVSKALRNEGYSLREIAKLLGYNNPQSIKHLLSKI